jgi:hypothetical protein
MTIYKMRTPATRIDKGNFLPEGATQAAQKLWDDGEGRLQIKLTFDAEWGGAHPHALCVWDDEGPLAFAFFADPADAKQAYDDMNATFRRLYEENERAVSRKHYWADLILQFLVVASAVGLVVSFLFTIGG